MNGATEDDDGSLSSSSFSSSSSSSDDEFLTTGDAAGKSAEDREAIIRKKLLESFYGAGAAAAASSSGPTPPPPPPPAAAAPGDSLIASSAPEPRSAAAAEGGDASRETAGAVASSSEDPASRHRRQASSAASSVGGGGVPSAPPDESGSTTGIDDSDDLDSPRFDASAHATRHIRNDGTKTLLEVDESLALEVRSLDSTMQTLVYENYSKFIDATDAIRSIGRSVSSNEDGLDRLERGVEAIERGTKSVDDALRASREAVAEKLRVRRLLNRLDSLLKLPTTLRTRIEAGKYRLAAKSHLSAVRILTRHSAGFESLRSIEAECHSILLGMVSDLKRKLLVWSGEEERTRRERESPMMRKRREMDAGGAGSFEEEEDDDAFGTDRYDDDLPSVAPPESVAEIFECAGTLLMLSSTPPSEGSSSSAAERGGAGGASATEAQPYACGLNGRECKSLALESCGRLLERSLDAHRARMTGGEEEEEEEDEEELERLRWDSELRRRTNAPPASSSTKGSPEADGAPSAGTSLVPTAFLDGMLESATLYGVTFPRANANAEDDGGYDAAKDEDGILLGDFVSGLFAAFLGHVKMALLERTLHATTPDGVDEEEEERLDDGETGDEQTAGVVASGKRSEAAMDREIAAALSHLLRSARELASGLALPEVGLDVSLASRLVDQAAELAESTVRRGVARKFDALRGRVLRRCLGPFARDAIVLPEDDEAAAVAASAGGGGNNINGSAKLASSAGATARVVQVVQMASVALSDGLQLVDDAVREILSRNRRRHESEAGAAGGGGSPDSAGSGAADAAVAAAPPVDPALVERSVRRNARRFALWLASSLEILAGCDPSDERTTLEATDVADLEEAAEEGATGAGEAAGGGVGGALPPPPPPEDDDTSETSGPFGGGGGAAAVEDEDLVDVALRDVAAQLEEEGTAKALSDLALGVSEMCRLAETSVSDSVRQSMRSCAEEDDAALARASGFFESSVNAKGRGSGAGSRPSFDADGSVSSRFRLAASRILARYAVGRGAEAAAAVCEGLFEVSAGPEDDGVVPSGPREGTLRALEVVRSASLDCADVFGGERSAGPPPSPPADDDDDVVSALTAPTPAAAAHRASPSLGGGPRQFRVAAAAGAGGDALKGLQLDVERMFAERVRVYPIPHRMEFGRNAVTATVMKVAFKSFVEQSRICAFTPGGYRQVQVDVAFLRVMVPHYVKDEVMADGTNGSTSLMNLLNDVLMNAGDRCADPGAVDVEEHYDAARGAHWTPRSIVRRFMMAGVDEEDEDGGTDVMSRIVILDA